MSFEKGDVSRIYDVLVFVGNGAVKNGNEPLRRAIDKLVASDPPLLRKVRSANSESFHQLAILSYKFRIEKTYLYKKFFKDLVNCKESDISKYLAGNNIVDGFLNLRKDIALEFNGASNLRLNIDPEIEKIIGDDCLFFTTNWDNVLWQHSFVQNLIHMHGRCNDHESIVMPTELLIEELMYDLKPVENEILKFKRVLAEKIINIFRASTLPDLGNVIINSEKQMLSAKKLIIWGYSLGDYDADINARIATWKADDDSELWVINPDLRVLNRAMALTGCQNAKLYDPVSKLVHTIE